VLFRRLIAMAPLAGCVPSLLPSRWTAWDHGDRVTWPARGDTGRDLNRFPGPRWVDLAARRVRERLIGYDAPRRVGHGGLGIAEQWAEIRRLYFFGTLAARDRTVNRIASGRDHEGDRERHAAEVCAQGDRLEA
jgi:hypothetical protein